MVGYKAGIIAAGVACIRHILIPLENSKTDSVILEYIRPLARFTNARLTIIHVADGFMARNQKQLAESEEMRKDREYLAKIEESLRADGFTVNAVLACGEPAEHILATAEQRTVRSDRDVNARTSGLVGYHFGKRLVGGPASDAHTGVDRAGLICQVAGIHQVVTRPIFFGRCSCQQACRILFTLIVRFGEHLSQIDSRDFSHLVRLVNPPSIGSFLSL